MSDKDIAYGLWNNNTPGWMMDCHGYVAKYPGKEAAQSILDSEKLGSGWEAIRIPTPIAPLYGIFDNKAQGWLRTYNGIMLGVSDPMNREVFHTEHKGFAIAQLRGLSQDCHVYIIGDDGLPRELDE